jgi:transposase
LYIGILNRQGAKSDSETNTFRERVYIILVKDHEYPQLSKIGKVVAVDVGVEKLLIKSDGERSQRETLREGIQQD